MEKYAFFIDIDGTLYNGKCVPEENIRAVNRALSEGHYVFISTGRCYHNIGEEILNAAPWSGVISGAGSEIRIGDEITEKSLSGEQVYKIVELALERKGWCCIGNKEKPIGINIPSRPEWYQATSLEQIKKDYPRLAVTKLDFEGDVSPELASAMEEEMYIHRYDVYCEAVIKGCSKSEAMKYIGKKLGISVERVVAMGDSANDRDALEYAGISVAMGNAPEAIKAIADIVSESSSNAGVGKAMEKILYEI